VVLQLYLGATWAKHGYGASGDMHHNHAVHLGKTEVRSEGIGGRLSGVHEALILGPGRRGWLFSAGQRLRHIQTRNNDSAAIGRVLLFTCLNGCLSDMSMG
jgi:hypothetical protein